MKTRVKIADLKAHLSEYVKRARAGEQIIVCDRETPVAELSPLSTPAPDSLPIRRAAIAWSEVAATITPVPANVPIDVVALLREDRDRR